LAQSDIESADIFLCNHKHIQSFVNSVLIIAKTLSLSPSLARAFIIEASAKERERERKKEKKRYTILIFFSCEEKKKGVHEKKKERKKT
jgi:7,8-dihydro-6-hydroxymethylpterin-pyrophosphokinase